MNIETFELERIQSVWENIVKYNLTESGVHPYTLGEFLDKNEIEDLLSCRLGYGQTNGSIELRTAISRLYPDTNIDNVLVTNGSAEANFIAIWNLLEPGDELVYMVPNYMQISGLARSLGIKVKPFYLKEKLNWQPDLEELRKSVSPKTKMIAVCNPNNPTGAVLSETAREEIIRLAQNTGAWLFADEVYRGAELDGQETLSFSNAYEKTIISCGLSKSYALPGLRIGWLVGPEQTIKSCWASHDYTTICSGILSNRVATLALQPERREKIFNRNRTILAQNLEILIKWQNKHNDLFDFIPPKAGGMAFLHYNMDINSTVLVTKLREEKDILIIPGDCFGMDFFIRIGIGSEKDYFLDGLKLIDEGLQNI